MKRILVILTLLAVFCMGCSPYWYRNHNGHIVTSSNFNRLTISYQRTPTSPRIRCDIDGNGRVVVVEGSAAVVTNQFDISQASTYGKVNQYSCVLPQETITTNLQSLVNAGLLTYEEPDEDAPAFPRILLSGRVNGIAIEKFTFNEDLITEIQILLSYYKNRGGYVIQL
jgi:hypothetical protein